MSWFYTIEPEYKECTKKELIEYINKYPRELKQDMYMGHAAWYDFKTAPYWPEALRVASFNFEYEESDFYICVNAEDVFNSRIPNRWAIYKNWKWVKTEDGKIVNE